MLFNKIDLQNFKQETITDEVLDLGTWPCHHRRIFHYLGKYYETFYTEGVSPYAVSTDRYPGQPVQIDCPEVTPKTVVNTVYVRV